MSALVLFEKNESIARITLNNPDRLNAITPEMGQALKECVSKVNEDSTIRLVLISGSGKAFSAGGNLNFILEKTTQTPYQNKRTMVDFYSTFLSVRSIEVPTIALINGPAVGAGFCLALACDIRLASSDSKMAVNFAKLGLSAGMGGHYFLTQIAGPAVAADLLFSARTIEAIEAKNLGLVNAVYEQNEFEEKSLSYAKQIAQNSPIALKIMKRGIEIAKHASLEEIFDYEASGQALCFNTEDLKEGVAAIQRKRSPHFKGN